MKQRIKRANKPTVQPSDLDVQSKSAATLGAAEVKRVSKSDDNQRTLQTGGSQRPSKASGPHPRPKSSKSTDAARQKRLSKTGGSQHELKPGGDGHATGVRGASKQDRVLALLRRKEGVTIPAVMKLTGWQSHSVRGFFAAAVRKRLGLNLVSEKTDRGRIYRIALTGGGKSQARGKRKIR